MQNIPVATSLFLMTALSTLQDHFLLSLPLDQMYHRDSMSPRSHTAPCTWQACNDSVSSRNDANSFKCDFLSRGLLPEITSRLPAEQDLVLVPQFFWMCKGSRESHVTWPEAAVITFHRSCDFPVGLAGKNPAKTEPGVSEPPP